MAHHHSAQPSTVARGISRRLGVSHETSRLSAIWTSVCASPRVDPTPTQSSEAPAGGTHRPSPTDKGGTRAAAQGQRALAATRSLWRAWREGDLARREHGCILSLRWADNPLAPSGTGSPARPRLGSCRGSVGRVGSTPTSRGFPRVGSSSSATAREFRGGWPAGLTADRRAARALGGQGRRPRECGLRSQGDEDRETGLDKAPKHGPEGRSSTKLHSDSQRRSGA